ncbi:MAG TPA: RDD family protein [Sunxiuqinia sp.]|nr:RDD family protein [Sunxiuqinia sp.]
MVTKNKLASKNLRIINLITDSLVVSLVGGIAPDFLRHSGVITSGTEKLILLFSVICYYLLSETLTATTIGKRITKTKVVTVDNEKPTFKHILLRTLLRFNPFDLFSYAFGLSVGSHDYYSKTRVIRSDQAFQN